MRCVMCQMMAISVAVRPLASEERDASRARSAMLARCLQPSF